MNWLIQNVILVNPGNGSKKEAPQDILIRKGKIEAIGKSLKGGEGVEVFDGKGLHAFPGLVDLHTHFREPGYEAKETIHTGSLAALRGGYVASVSMPNTNPACDQASIVETILRKAKDVPYHIYPCGTISKGREGRELSEMADMKKAGIVAVSDDGSWVPDSLLMRRAMEYASMLDLIVMSHCEDGRLSAGGVMNESFTSTRLGLHGIPAASENVAVARDIELAKLTGAHLHICHISTARAVELVRRAKQEGLKITTEVTPHNLVLTDEMVEGYNTNAKMYPPLRTQQDTEALRQGLRDGVIDCIATDHAPHTEEDKMVEFDHAAFGTLGLETSLAVILTDLHHKEAWTLNRIVELVSARPAEILKQKELFGAIREGKEANLTLIDVGREWTVSRDDFSSKSRNSVFMGRKMKGKVMATFCLSKLWKF